MLMLITIIISSLPIFETTFLTVSFEANILQVFKAAFTATTFDLVHVGPKKYVMPDQYRSDMELYRNFRCKADDVFLMSYPMSGHDWISEVIWLLKNNLNFEAAASVAIDDRFVLLEKTLTHEQKGKWLPAESLRSPRLIRTQLPFSLVPSIAATGKKIIYLARNPKDTMLASFRFHSANNSFSGNMEAYWEFFGNDLSLYSPYWSHVHEAHAQKWNKRVLFLYAEDESLALVTKLSKFLGKTYSEQELKKVCDFVNSKKYIASGAWKSFFSEKINIEMNGWIKKNIGTMQFPNIDIYAGNEEKAPAVPPPKVTLAHSELVETFKSSFTNVNFSLAFVGSEKYLMPANYKNQYELYYNFHPKPDDVYLMSFPNSGHECVSEIIWLLKNNLNFEASISKSIDERFVLLEKDLKHQSTVKELPVNSLPSPRCIRTEQPFSLVPKITKSAKKIIYLQRNPKDTMLSAFHSYSRNDSLGFSGNIEAYWNFFGKDLAPHCPYWSHLKEGLAQKDNERVLQLTAEDDLLAMVTKISLFLDKKYTDQELQNVTNFVSSKYTIVNYGWKTVFSEKLNVEMNEWILKNRGDIKFPRIDVYSHIDVKQPTPEKTPKVKLARPEVSEAFKSAFTNVNYSLAFVGPDKYVVPDRYEKQYHLYYNYEAKPEDVILMSFPMSGHEWISEVIWLLNNKLDFDAAISNPLEDRHIYLEKNLMDKEIFKHELPTESLPSPRLIRTEQPFSMLPNVSTSTNKIIYLTRNPKDTLLSCYQSHSKNTSLGFSGSIENYWNFFQKDLSLFSPYWSHVQEGFVQKLNKNVLFLSAEDNRLALIIKISAFLEKAYSVSELIKVSHFMKLKPRIANGAWKKVFSKELNNEVNQWIFKNKGDMKFTQMNINLCDV